MNDYEMRKMMRNVLSVTETLQSQVGLDVEMDNFLDTLVDTSMANSKLSQLILNNTSTPALDQFASTISSIYDATGVIDNQAEFEQFTKSLFGTLGIDDHNALLNNALAINTDIVPVLNHLTHDISVTFSDIVGTSLAITTLNSNSMLQDYFNSSWYQSLADSIVKPTSQHLIAFDLLHDMENSLTGKHLYIPDFLADIRLQSLLITLEDLEEDAEIIEDNDEFTDIEESDNIPQLYVADFTQEFLRILSKNIEELLKLDPEKFELLVLDRLKAMGYKAVRTTKSVYAKDGGVDIIARPNAIPLSQDWIAVQVKHHSEFDRKVDAPTVSQLAGVLTENNIYFRAAMLVTNTSFTKSALDWQMPYLTLADGQDLMNWLRNNFSIANSPIVLPETVRLKGGIEIPRSQMKSLW